MGFTSLNQHIDLAWLHEAYVRTRKDGAVGVDGQTAADYEANLQKNPQSLLDRAKSGTYKAPPVRRVHIPKGSGGDTRPIGIPTFEDKVLQRAVVLVLEAVYEQDFYEGSYGFRPGRSAHQALDAPAPTDHGTTPDAEPEAQRALRVLRDHRQRPCVVHVPPRSDADLAKVAVSPPSSG